MRARNPDTHTRAMVHRGRVSKVVARTSRLQVCRVDQYRPSASPQAFPIGVELGVCKGEFHVSDYVR